MTNSIRLSQLLQAASTNMIDVIPAGRYRLQVISCKARTNDLTPIFRITEGTYKGMKIMVGTFSIKGNASSIFFQQMSVFGLGEEFFATNPSLTDTAKALMGRVIDAEIKVEQWNNQERNVLFSQDPGRR